MPSFVIVSPSLHALEENQSSSGTDSSFERRSHLDAASRKISRRLFKSRLRVVELSGLHMSCIA